MLAPGRGTRGSWVLAVTSRAAGGRASGVRAETPPGSSLQHPPPPAYPSRALPALLLPRTLFIFLFLVFALR